LRLPNVERAKISERKIIKYLLSTTHRAGKSKAAFFIGHGFHPDRFEELVLALKRHAAENEIVLEGDTDFGTRYVIDGQLRAMDGSWLDVRSAWFVDHASEIPRFITAHPLKRRRS
jgi:hypothetical protein